jgi:hypothetical protein
LYLYTCVVFLWLIPHPTVIWLIYGSKECHKYVCIVFVADFDLEGFLQIYIVHKPSLFYNLTK